MDISNNAKNDKNAKKPIFSKTQKCHKYGQVLMFLWQVCVTLVTFPCFWQKCKLFSRRDVIWKNTKNRVFSSSKTWKCGILADLSCHLPWRPEHVPEHLYLHISQLPSLYILHLFFTIFYVSWHKISLFSLKFHFFSCFFTCPKSCFLRFFKKRKYSNFSEKTRFFA